MAELPNDPWLNAFVNLVVLGSVATWIFIISRWRNRGELLAYEPRRPVPWGAPAALLAVVFVLMAVLSPLALEPPEAARPRDPAEIALRILAALAPQVLIVAAFFFAIAVVYRATWDDLGLPRSVSGFLRDAAIGIFTCLAAVLPVHTVQVLLLYLSGLEDEPSRHPLVELVTKVGEPSTAVLAIASVAAVVIAPICEEITFRLFLQGWLEKWEVEQLARAQLAFPTMMIDVDEATAGVTVNGEARTTNDDAGGLADSTFDIRHSSFASRPPLRGIAGLPYGWFPILTSSLLFGLAHFGYGPEPIPLFLLAIFLGYVYQRTHRIIPCIVAHALFNLLTMLVLWRMVFHAAK